jgi:hypothetical protein
MARKLPIAKPSAACEALALQAQPLEAPACHKSKRIDRSSGVVFPQEAEQWWAALRFRPPYDW